MFDYECQDCSSNYFTKVYLILRKNGDTLKRNEPSKRFVRYPVSPDSKSRRLVSLVSLQGFIILIKIRISISLITLSHDGLKKEKFLYLCHLIK